uniref:Uncharacterized protein n=1 Tax=Ciona intestinalis TaxID=7719 RepID=H2XZ58_CIOIN
MTGVESLLCIEELVERLQQIVLFRHVRGEHSSLWCLHFHRSQQLYMEYLMAHHDHLVALYTSTFHT